PYAAAGACAAITLGTALCAGFLLIRHKIKGDGITKAEMAASPAPRPYKQNLKTLALIAVPVVMGALVTSIAGMVDLVTVHRRLMDAVRTDPAGLIGQYGDYLPPGTAITELPNFLYGVYKGYVFSFFSLIPTITAMLGVSALPAVAAMWTRKDKTPLKVNVESVVRVTAIISLPAGAVMSVLAGPILSMMYRGSPGEAAVSMPLLSVMAVSGAFAGMSIPITNMLQGIGKQKLPVRNMIIGAAVKLAVNFFLVADPEINIKGAAFGSLGCYIVIFLLNFYDLCKYSGFVPNILKTVLKPAAAALLCAAASWAAYKSAQRVIDGSIIPLCLGICAAGIVYVIVLILLRTITREDVLMLPKGEKFVKTLEKLHCIS
ncbi:MAG TPA: hypothetical protein DEQ02_01540, partial [Ruminococcaceae bacterium]|nr:hypothetical protein [Oscillospiraceae bacterium]